MATAEKERTSESVSPLQVFDIQMAKAQVRHGSRVGENMPFPAVREHQRTPVAVCLRHPDPAYVDAARAQPLQGNLTQLTPRPNRRMNPNVEDPIQQDCAQE